MPTLIVLPILAPIIAWPAITLSVDMQTACLTPPFGFALVHMKGTVAPSVTTRDIHRGIAPFVIVQLAAPAACLIRPEIVLRLPRESGFLD